jgi:hypothetical protein
MYCMMYITPWSKYSTGPYHSSINCAAAGRMPQLCRHRQQAPHSSLTCLHASKTPGAQAEWRSGPINTTCSSHPTCGTLGTTPNTTTSHASLLGQCNDCTSLSKACPPQCTFAESNHIAWAAAVSCQASAFNLATSCSSCLCPGYCSNGRLHLPPHATGTCCSPCRWCASDCRAAWGLRATMIFDLQCKGSAVSASQGKGVSIWGLRATAIFELHCRGSAYIAIQ